MVKAKAYENCKRIFLIKSRPRRKGKEMIVKTRWWLIKNRTLKHVDLLRLQVDDGRLHLGQIDIEMLCVARAVEREKK